MSDYRAWALGFSCFRSLFLFRSPFPFYVFLIPFPFYVLRFTFSGFDVPFSDFSRLFSTFLTVSAPFLTFLSFKPVLRPLLTLFSWTRVYTLYTPLYTHPPGYTPLYTPLYPPHGTGRGAGAAKRDRTAKGRAGKASFTGPETNRTAYLPAKGSSHT